MKLLVDNQLPAALARYLNGNGFDCIHVQDVGMEASDDRDIWDSLRKVSTCSIAGQET